MNVAHPKVYADFQNADPLGRLRLNCIGTLQDLSRQQVQLAEGLVLTLYADDADAQGRPEELQAEGRVTYSPEERCWVATIDWTAIRHVPQEFGAEVNGSPAHAKDGVKGDRTFASD